MGSKGGDMNYYCSNCGKEIVDDSNFCSSCGKSLTSIETTKKEVIIFGYQEKFAFNTSVKIYKNNEYIGSVKGGENYNAGILDKDSLFEFKATIRSTSMMMSAGKPHNIQLSYDRLTGQLLAIAADNNYTIQNELKNKDGKSVIIIVLIILFFIVIAFMGI
jgi:hypothetical protein